MRPIKFRYYNKALNGSIYKEELELSDIETGNTKDFYQTIAKVQFTGLLDKNGKEIYEGDIIEWISFENGKERSEVIYSGYKFTLYHAAFQSLARVILIGEIIGNIYENPELLK